VRSLRDFGFGKRQSMQEVIESEICLSMATVTKMLENTKGILTIDHNFAISVINIFWAMVAGRRYAHDDPKLLAMLNLTIRGTKVFTPMSPQLVFSTLYKWMGKALAPFGRGLMHFGQEFFIELSSIIQVPY